MRYSQPFATPTPPLGVYPRYINGNPVTGTEGSIPPATAFDEDQIEIVNVIASAGLTPDHNDLTQLWQAIQGLIAQKYITTAVVKKVHGAGADFVDLNVALQWLSQFIITPTGSVTFMVAAGRWTYTQTVEINHPNSNRISIQGGALLGASPTPDNLSVSGYHTSSDGSAQIIYLRSVYATELSFAGPISGFFIVRGGATLRYLLITGSQSGSDETLGAQGLNVRDLLYLDGVAIWGFGANGIYILNTMVIQLTSLSVTSCFNGMYGIECMGGSFLGQYNSYVTLHSNAAGGVFQDGGYSWFQVLSCMGSGLMTGATWGGGIGALLYAGGFLACNYGSNFSFNGYAGAYLSGACTFNGEYSYYQNNGEFGVVVQGTGTGWIVGSSIGANGTADIANSGGYLLGP